MIRQKSPFRRRAGAPAAPGRTAPALALTVPALVTAALVTALAVAPGASADANDVPPAGSSPVCAFYDGDDLTLFGEQGDRVFQVQCMLANRRYLPWEAVDGTFGLVTLDAVRRFQSEHPPLVPDGLVGADTWAALWRGTGTTA
ncbi:peptidoglycan-binding domain-containing protein [Streptomyces sp. ITFR-16]|uniref:peptidoglycan-binding domain-containing protein n=1 Tax=Streptomyces sp. ITFR-16 TaxID=3075198 RepID=UPI00288BFCB1|nr:peptidoglycan-binding domain-containing protein [Streptomyces sp. ITFR-16]WNI24713.1 peptidoglycan-binding domain-containing protein [Streptomyces sp. ITFR-16]